jgi:hypothetical protein
MILRISTPPGTQTTKQLIEPPHLARRRNLVDEALEPFPCKVGIVDRYTEQDLMVLLEPREDVALDVVHIQQWLQQILTRRVYGTVRRYHARTFFFCTTPPAQTNSYFAEFMQVDS